MANNPNLTGWGRVAWNTGAWNTPGTIVLTGVSAATAVGSVQIGITVPVTGVSAAAVIGTAVASGGSNFDATGLSAATEVGLTNVVVVVEVTGVEASTAVGRVNIWQVIIPGQDAGWNKIAA